MERDEPHEPPGALQLRCARCGEELIPGHGMLYEVNIHGVADPFPPVLPDWDVATIRQQLERTIAALRDVTPEEAMNQVHRRVTIYLCTTCFHDWIDDPAGRK